MSDLLKARTAPDILAALARALIEPCPAEAMPTPAALAEWLHDCPEAAFVEATTRLDAMTVGAAEWVWTVNRPLPGLSAPDMTPEVIAHDGYYIASVVNLHARWLDLPEDERPWHPLAPIVRAWQMRPVEVEPFRPRHRAALPDLHRPRREDLPDLPMLPATARKPAWLPGMEPTVGGCPSWLLALFDQAGGRSMRPGRGAPWDLRLFVAALLSLPVESRDGRPRDLTFKAGEVAAWLHPRGWDRANRRRDWPAFLRALGTLGALRVPMEVSACWPDDGTTEIRDVALVACADAPREWRDGLARVTFTVRAPGSEGPGVRIDWPRLVAYGADSAPLYRGYLAVSAALHRTARRGAPAPKLIGAPELRPDGRPRRRKGGAIVRQSGPGAAMVPHPAAGMAPVWTDADAARFIGLDPAHRESRARARRMLDRLHDDGVIEVERTARGVRLYGPDGRPVGGKGA